MKNNVYVTVVGKPSSGKTTIMSAVVRALQTSGIETQAIWGREGSLYDAVYLDRLKSAAKNTKVVVAELEYGKYVEESDNYDISVEHKVGVGFILTLNIGGIPLKANFGEFDYSREKALAIGTRLAADLGLEVRDTTPRVYQVQQSRDYVP